MIASAHSLRRVVQTIPSTLYVTTQGAVLRLEHDTIRILVEGATLARLPLVRLQALVVFGRVTVTTPLIHRCAEDGRALVWMSTHGRFRARLTGRTLGNVLRRAGHVPQVGVTVHHPDQFSPGCLQEHLLR